LNLSKRWFAIKIEMKASKARGLIARRASAENHQDFLREKFETQRLLESDAERDFRRKISQKNNDSTRTSHH
jgi:hypothetical protein